MSRIDLLASHRVHPPGAAAALAGLTMLEELPLGARCRARCPTEMLEGSFQIICASIARHSCWSEADWRPVAHRACRTWTRGSAPPTENHTRSSGPRVHGRLHVVNQSPGKGCGRAKRSGHDGTGPCSGQPAPETGVCEGHHPPQATGERPLPANGQRSRPGPAKRGGGAPSQECLFRAGRPGRRQPPPLGPQVGPPRARQAASRERPRRPGSPQAVHRRCHPRHGGLGGFRGPDGAGHQGRRLSAHACVC